jgi:hypothetical protein
MGESKKIEGLSRGAFCASNVSGLHQPRLLFLGHVLSFLQNEEMV